MRDFEIDDNPLVTQTWELLCCCNASARTEQKNSVKIRVLEEIKQALIAVLERQSLPRVVNKQLFLSFKTSVRNDPVLWLQRRPGREVGSEASSLPGQLMSPKKN